MPIILVILHHWNSLSLSSPHRRRSARPTAAEELHRAAVGASGEQCRAEAI